MPEQQLRDKAAQRSTTVVFGTIVTSASVIALSLALHYAYRTQISPTFSYQGLRYRPPDTWGLITSTLLAVVTANALPRRITKPSHFVLWVVFIVAALPAILITQYADILSRDDSLLLAFNVSGTLIVARIVAAGAPERLVPNLQGGLGRHFWLVVGVYSVLVYALLVAFVGVHFRFLSFTDVYDVRSEFGEATVGIPAIGYLLPLQYNVINPILILRGLYARRLPLLLIGAGGQALIYMTVGQKSVLLSTGAIFAFALLFRGKKPLSGARIMIATTLGTIGAIGIDKLTGSIMMTSLFVRRFLVVSGVLTAAYVAVFANKPKLDFSDSILPFLTDPYAGGLDPTHIVGAAFVGNAGTAANVSLFGHGYLSFGYIGMYVEGIVLAIVLWLVDDASRGLPVKIAALVFLMPAISISSASIFTTMLTHGLLGAVILAAMMPRTGWERRRNHPPPAQTARERAVVGSPRA